MKFHRLVASLFLTLIVIDGAHGDTIHFKDGTVVDGVILEERVNSVIARVGEERVAFRRSTITKIEKNDKKSADTLGEQRIRARDEQLLEETGLDRAQRDEMAAHLRGLSDRSESVRLKARERLVELGRENGGFEFLAGLVPHIRFVGAELLEVLAALDQKKLHPFLEEMAVAQYAAIRGKAIELIGRLGFNDLSELVARGFADDQITVRGKAAEGMASLKDRRATPLLIEGMRSYEPRFSNTCRDALRQIWSDATLDIDFATADEWQTYWDSHSSTVPHPWDKALLAPLYRPSPNGPDPLFH